MDLPEYQLKTNTLKRRLGDYLISAGIITPELLDEAIESQCIFGGKLGTNLIELGLIEEEHLAKILSQQLNLHYIKPKLLMNVPEKILDLVPQNLALKHQVVPYHKEKEKIFLAMKDSSNLAVIDELSFQLNHIIIPLAVPEVRLMLALKKHYGLELSPRFESIEAKIDHPDSPLPKAPETSSKTNGNPNNKIPSKISIKRVINLEKEHSSEQSDSWPLLGEGNDQEAIVADSVYFDFGTSPKEMSQTSLAQQLVSATDRNDIARSLINYLAQEFSVSALFMVRADIVHGWLAKYGNIEPTGFDRLQINLQKQSIFNQLVENKSYFLGSVSDTPQNSLLLKFFDTQPPQTALIVPLLVKDRLVSILYLQDRLEILEKNFFEVQKMAQKAQMAFTLLILKNKILTI